MERLTLIEQEMKVEGGFNRIDEAFMVDIGVNEKIVCVIGLSGAGKSTIAKMLAQRFSYHLISTDSYLPVGSYGSAPALNTFMQDVMYILSDPQNKVIIEGSLCYRLLLRGAEQNVFQPHLIVNVVASAAERHRRRPDKDYSSMDTMYRKMWADYLYHVGRYSNYALPRIIELNNGGFVQPEYK